MTTLRVGVTTCAVASQPRGRHHAPLHARVAARAPASPTSRSIAWRAAARGGPLRRTRCQAESRDGGATTTPSPQLVGPLQDGELLTEAQVRHPDGAAGCDGRARVPRRSTTHPSLAHAVRCGRVAAREAAWSTRLPRFAETTRGRVRWVQRPARVKQLELLTVEKGLKPLLRLYGLATGGTKPALMGRIIIHEMVCHPSLHHPCTRRMVLTPSVPPSTRWKTTAHPWLPIAWSPTHPPPPELGRRDGMAPGVPGQGRGTTHGR